MPAPLDPAGPALAARLKLRAALFAVVRAFFSSRGVTEVDTPALAPGGNPDPAVEPIRATPASLAGLAHYLHTSPELAMKRLLAAGSGDIWQLCRVFRDGELGRWHEPEFLLLEWYRTGFDEHRLMREVSELLNACFALSDKTLPVTTMTYAAACRQLAAVDPFAPTADLIRAVETGLAAAGIDPPADLDRDAALDATIGMLVAPRLPRDAIVFVHDYPADQAALAMIRNESPPVAARFEVFVDGLELGNGFRELTDAGEQRDRFMRDAGRRERAGLPAVRIDENFLAALATGLPDCAGVALGFDRIAAAVLGADTLGDALSLPHAPQPDRPQD